LHPAASTSTSLVTFGSDNVIAIMVNNDERYDTVGYAATEIPYGQPFNNNYGGINRDVTLHIMDKFLPDAAALSKSRHSRHLHLSDKHQHACEDRRTHRHLRGQERQRRLENRDPRSRHRGCRRNQVGSTLTAAQQTVANGAKATFTINTSMTGIHFWSPAYPYLYQVYTILKVGGVAVDVTKTPLGVRKVIFNRIFGMQINGYPLYLNGLCPRAPRWNGLAWALRSIGLTEYDFKMMRDNNANFVRQMHIAPRKIQVDAADKFGIVMTVPAANNEGDSADANQWQQRLEYDARCHHLFPQQPERHLLRSVQPDRHRAAHAGHAQCPPHMGSLRRPPRRHALERRRRHQRRPRIFQHHGYLRHPALQPLWDAEYARGEAPRRVWDNYTPC